MKRMHLAWVFSALLIAACGDDGGTNPATDTTGGTDTVTSTDTLVGDTSGGGTTSAITGVSTAGVSCSAPTPNAACTGLNTDAATSGFSYPWCGLTTSAKSYTCNGCPFGRVDFGGKYRAMKDGLSDPPVMDFEDYKEIIDIDGNTFHIKVQDDSGKTFEARGWFMCANKGEQVNEHAYWVITSATPADGSWFPGAVLETDHVVINGTDRWYASWYDSVGSQTYTDLEYCRIGSTIFGEDCTDPFAN